VRLTRTLHALARVFPAPIVRRLPRKSSTARFRRIAGTVLLVAGICVVAWTIVVWRWQDPFTALYTTWEQHKLSSTYRKAAEAYRPLPAGRAGTAAERRLIALEPRRYRATLHDGVPLGRLKVPRLGLNMVLITGTDHSSLIKGPGWYEGSFLPGEGELVYLAGHRTTYLAPFAHIDSLRRGDKVTIEVPYGTFVYEVRSHVIVPADDVARLRSHGREVLALQACHPRFFATHRYIVYAAPVLVTPRSGPPYRVRST